MSGFPLPPAAHHLRQLLELPRLDVVGVLVIRKRPRPHLPGIIAHRLGDRPRQIDIRLRKLRPPARADPQNVRHDQNLPVAIRPRPATDHRHRTPAA